jgi:cation diffusion facilitator family transporter
MTRHTDALPGAARRRERERAAWLSLSVGSAVFAGKLCVYLATRSTAVYSDALESVVNVVAAALLLYSVRLAAQPPDRNHPYGHGKIEFFSAGVEGTLIAIAALAILGQAGRELWLGPRLHRVDLALLGTAALAGVNALLGVYLIRLGQRTASLALEADGRHLMTDVATSVGVVAGLALVRVTGLLWLDPLCAIAVAVNILAEGWRLVRRAVGGLMDEADPARLEQIVESLRRERRPWWIDVHGLRAWRSGAVTHVDLHLTVPRYFDAERLHAVGEELEDAIRGALGAAVELIAHYDPCGPRLCGGCAMLDCAVRAARCERQVPVTLEASVRGAA